MRWIRTLPWVIALVSSLVAVGLWYWPDASPTYYGRRPPAPYIAPESPIVEEVVRTPAEIKTEVLRPNKRETERIEEEIGGQLPPGDITGVVEVDELPYGGVAVTYFDPITYDLETGAPLPQRAQVKIYPSERPFFENLLPDRELGFFYGIEGGMYEYFRVEFTQPVIRAGAVYLEFRAGYKKVFILDDDWYAEVGAKVRF